MKTYSIVPTRRRMLRLTLVFFATLAVFIASQGSTRVLAGSAMQHVDLGFNASFPFNLNPHDSAGIDCCASDLCIPLCCLPPLTPHRASYNITVNGTGSINLDAPADLTFSYDKGGILAGNTLPVSVTYSPASGGSISLDITADVSVEGKIEICTVPDISDTVTFNKLTILSGSGALTAPLTGDADVSVPVTSSTITAKIDDIAGVEIHAEGTVTLMAVPNSGDLPGLAGAAAVFNVSGPATAPLIPVLEWDTTGQTVDASLTLANPLPGNADVTLNLTPLFHWVATSADVNVIVHLTGALGDIIGDPSPISVFSGSLGTVYKDVHLDTEISGAVPSIVSAQVTAAIDAGDIPIPLTDPELQVIDPSTTPKMGTVSFTFSTDVTPPVTTASLNPPATPAGWNDTTTVVKLNSSDVGGTGVQSITYSASGANPILTTIVPGAVALFSIVNPGITTITFFATDNAGNVEAGKTQVVRIDEIPPLITIVQPAAANYTHSSVLTLIYTVTDSGGSGLDSFVAQLDGSTTLAGHGLASGQAINLLTELPLGDHTFTINALDLAGNTSSASVTFSIIVTADSIKQDVQQFVAAGQIKLEGQPLLASLKAALARRAAGDCATAANILNAFINKVNAQTGKGIDPTAAAILIADAQYLIAHCP